MGAAGAGSERSVLHVACGSSTHTIHYLLLLLVGNRSSVRTVLGGLCELGRERDMPPDAIEPHGARKGSQKNSSEQQGSTGGAKAPEEPD